MSTSRLIRLAVTAVLLVPALYGFGLPVSLDLEVASPAWADAGEATIHPGVQVVTQGAQCTANFVFTKDHPDGTRDVFLGMAAHCAGTGGQSDTNGCTTGSHPLGTRVDIAGASRPGRLAYSSWLAMQQPGASAGANACAYNDFALILVDPADHDNVNPSMPAWGGPVGLGDGTGTGEEVFGYGNSSLRLGLLSPKAGLSLGMIGNGWAHQIYTVTPGIPGDSGSGLLDSSGRAVGVTSTIILAPLTGSNHFSDLASALAFAQTHGMGGVELATGDVPFDSALTGMLG